MAGKKDFLEEAAELRKRAEEKAVLAHEMLRAMSPEETRQALHELRIHQIELEMQNEELLRTQVELDTARARYFDLYDLAPVGYCTVGEKGLILESNLTAAVLLGEARGALVRQPISRFILKEDQDIYYLHRKNLFETGKPQTCEMHMVKKDGTVFWARLEATLAKDADGAPASHVMLSDITIRKKAEEVLKRDRVTLEKLVMEKSGELMESQLELERAKRLSDIGTLAVTVAHELRNPLFGISLATNIIRNKIADKTIDHQFKVIDKMLEESGQIIDNLLFYSRLRSPHQKKINLHSLLGECAATIQNACTRNNIVISKHIDSLKYAPISADSFQIREVFINILNNAVDATSENGGIIEIKARVYRELVKINISDNGHGISKEDLKRVFDPFFTTKLKGTGLGLTVCRQIVKMHRGSINIISRNGKGASVVVTLPIKKIKTVKAGEY